ncbi:GPR1/FUN34/YaaH family transporter [Streptomyces galilaeus]|uniref:GPR1/FUN34/YaaH family transporter n=1 Tax=Streptomyces galilaeus TaxID=33899 RepID=UPI0038F5F151
MPQGSAYANATTLGTAAVVISQVMLGIPHVHLAPATLSLLFVPTALVTGGLIQLISCVFAFLRGEEFSAVAFGLFGSFFLSLGMFPLLGTSGLLQFGPDTGTAVGTFLLVWGVFTLGITVIAFRRQRLLGVMFLFVTGSMVGAGLHFLHGLDTAVGGWSGIASAVVGAMLVFGKLWAPATAKESRPGAFERDFSGGALTR